MIRVNQNGETEIALINIFKAVQGEGPEAGVGATVFIRTHLCNLRCPWCDTKESWTNENLSKLYKERNNWESPIKWLTAKQIFDEVENLERTYYNKSICLTGGEPLMEQNKEFMLNELLPLFTEANYSIDIETNGAIDYTEYKQKFNNCKIIDSCGRRQGVYFSMDWKMPSSKMNSKMISTNLQLLNEFDIVKVVMTDSDEDWNELERLCNLNLKCPIYISPCFNQLELSKIPEFILKHNDKNLKAQIQLHKIYYSPTTKDV